MPFLKLLLTDSLPTSLCAIDARWNPLSLLKAHNELQRRIVSEFFLR